MVPGNCFPLVLIHFEPPRRGQPLNRLNLYRPMFGGLLYCHNFLMPAENISQYLAHTMWYQRIVICDHDVCILCATMNGHTLHYVGSLPPLLNILKVLGLILRAMGVAS